MRKAGSIVTVVGDDDQSIYAFREALGYRGMESFIKRSTRSLLCSAATIGAAQRFSARRTG